MRFYREGLGFTSDCIIAQEFEHGTIAFHQLQPGLHSALWPRSSVAHGSGLALDLAGSTEMILGHNVSSKADSMPPWLHPYHQILLRVQERFASAHALDSN